MKAHRHAVVGGRARISCRRPTLRCGLGCCGEEDSEAKPLQVPLAPDIRAKDKLVLMKKHLPRPAADSAGTAVRAAVERCAKIRAFEIGGEAEVARGGEFAACKRSGCGGGTAGRRSLSRTGPRGGRKRRHERKARQARTLSRDCGSRCKAVGAARRRERKGGIFEYKEAAASGPASGRCRGSGVRAGRGRRGGSG